MIIFKSKARIRRLESIIERLTKQIKDLRTPPKKQVPYKVGDIILFKDTPWDRSLPRMVKISRVFRVDGFARDEYSYLCEDMVSGTTQWLYHETIEKYGRIVEEQLAQK